jgi:hypothetical protein
MRLQKAAHWTGLALAAVPIPFLIGDIVELRPWDFEWWLLPFCIAYALLVCAVIYGLVRGVFWLVGKMAGKTA